MRLGRLVEFVQEALDDGDASLDTPVLLVQRNADVPLDHDDAWLEAALAAVERDADDINLVPGDDDAAVLNVGDLVAELGPVTRSTSELSVFIQSDTQTFDDGTEAWIHTPALAFRAVPEDGVVGVLALFDGWEAVLGVEAGQ